MIAQSTSSREQQQQQRGTKITREMSVQPHLLRIAALIYIVPPAVAAEEQQPEMRSKRQKREGPRHIHSFVGARVEKGWVDQHLGARGVQREA